MKTSRRPILIVIFMLLVTQLAFASVMTNPKREFRGAWISTVYQTQYAKNTTEQNQAYITGMLDKLCEVGVNVVIFQVRPSADAFYPSKYEPWSRYLTKGGVAPVPYWDPLEFIITEAHKRGMELHAWLNPYRVTTSKNERLAPQHIYNREPSRFIKYEGDGKIYFDPGLPENRRFIADVIADIVERYDVDGIHFDDYFYPYPANGKDFKDDSSFARYGVGMSRADWRRSNVDQLIELVSRTIRESSRPWVRFGISPFGIWRNKSSDPSGSDTNGLQNYDDLYADVLLWARRGWIDYLIPQIYWELDNKSASYITLVEWWPRMVPPTCQLYIGQDVDRSMTKPDIGKSNEPNQLNHKIQYTRQNERVQGNCWWPAYSITGNVNGAARQLSSGAQSTYALVPAYPNISQRKPRAVRRIKVDDANNLVWSKPLVRKRVNEATKYVVYRLPEPSVQLIDNSEYIYCITGETSMPLTAPGYYTVTCLDHANNESDPAVFINVMFE